MKFEKLKPSNPEVIAEIACGHEGNVAKFIELIDLVSSTNVKIIKSQIFLPEERASLNHPEREIFTKLAFSKRQWKEISDYIKQQGLIFFVDIFGLKGLEIAKGLEVGGYKIHSEDLLNSYFILEVARINKPLLIGVGGAHRKEIFQLLSFLKSKNACNKIILMPGIQTFPTPLKLHSIGEIQDLYNNYSQEFNVKIGCADHLKGNSEDSLIFPLACLTAGASVIEKHFTKDRSLKWEDYESAMDVKRFKKFLKKLDQYSTLLKKPSNLNSAEKNYRKQFKKVPVAQRTIRSGQKILDKDIYYSKEEKLKTPLSALNIVGKSSSKLIKKADFIDLSQLNENVGCVLVVRNGSQRLPYKAMKKIQGKETIRLLIERLKRLKNTNKLILATTNDKKDDSLVEIAKDENIEFYRGSRENLSQRFYETARKFSLDHIVRVTGDDLLRDEIMIDRAIESHLKESCDVTITTNMPYGCQSEIFSFATIQLIMEKVKIKENTEFLEWFLQNDRYFSVNHCKSNYIFKDEWRLTLDYKEDLEFFKAIFNNLYAKNKEFSLQNTLDFLSVNPDVVAINQSKVSKFETNKNEYGLYVSNEVDTSLKI